MADKTLGALVTDIQNEIYQMEGLAVQVYSQGIIVNKINDAFITFFDDKEIQWKRFQEYATYTLDGTTGTPTASVDDTFRQYDHIFRVYRAGSDSPLANWNTSRNPAMISGSAPVFVKPTNIANKVLQILPVAATGDIVVIGKALPTAWPYDDLEQDTVAFDYLAVKYYVAWQLLVDDGANPASAEVMLMKFKNRYAQLEANQGQEPVSYSGGRAQGNAGTYFVVDASAPDYVDVFQDALDG